MTRLFIPFLHIVCLCISVHQCREIPDYYGKYASDTNIHEKTTAVAFKIDRRTLTQYNVPIPWSIKTRKYLIFLEIDACFQGQHRTP